MDELRVDGSMSREKPDLRPLAQGLMEQIIRFYEDPEAEAAFREWKEKRKTRKGA